MGAEKLTVKNRGHGQSQASRKWNPHPTKEILKKKKKLHWADWEKISSNAAIMLSQPSPP